MAKHLVSPREGYWLGEDYVLRLTALEIGWLLAAVTLTRNSTPCNRPASDGSPVATTVKAEVMRKIELALLKGFGAGEKGEPGAPPPNHARPPAPEKE